MLQIGLRERTETGQKRSEADLASRTAKWLTGRLDSGRFGAPTHWVEVWGSWEPMDERRIYDPDASEQARSDVRTGFKGQCCSEAEVEAA